MTFSVIIPVYNDNGALQRCLQSVMAQSEEDYEVIIVDDGSDNKVEIDDTEKVHVIRIEHRGLSAARNAGIDIARGEYLVFLDADDCIGGDTLSVLAETTRKYHDSDIIEYPIHVHEGAPDAYMLNFEDKIYDNLIDDYWLGCKAYMHSYVCNKVYKRHLFDEVRFPVGRKFEDAYTLPLLLNKASSVCTVSKGLYHYMWNVNGICGMADVNDLSQLLKSHINTADMFKLENRNGFSEFFMYMLNIQIDVYRACKNIILPSYKIHSFPMNFNMKVKFLLYKIFGLKIVCRLWKHLS